MKIIHSASKRSGLIRCGAVAALAIMLGACAGMGTDAPRAPRRVIIGGLDVNAVNDVLVRGFGEIKDRAFEDPPIDNLFTAALAGLKSIDPEIRTISAGGRLIVTYRGQTIRDLGSASRNDIPAWSLATLQALVASRKASPLMLAADSETIYKAVFAGALTAIDPYSRYATRERAIHNRLVRDGVIGLGVRVVLEDDGASIQAIVDGGPAALAGLDLNDLITHANGVALAGRSIADIRRRLDGAIGTTVTLTAKRPGQAEPRVVAAELDLIVPDTVTSGLSDGVLEVRIASFNQRTAYAVEKAVTTAQRDNGGALKGIVLDLRGDPGGLLDQAIDVADLFLESGTIVTLHGRHPGANQYYAANRGDVAEGVPMAVVIDGRSASATEIVVAALQDNKRAAIVGTVSWGKGSVQSLRRLPNGGEIALTWARMVTPRGADVHGLGLLPDVCLSGAPASVNDVVDRLLAEAATGVAAHRRWLSPADDPALHESLRMDCPAETHADRMVDLEVARRIVTDPVLMGLVTFDDAPQLAVIP